MSWFAGFEFPDEWQRTKLGQLWHVLLMLLMVATAGAMLCAGGEMVARVLPVQGAYGIGLCVTMLLAWMLARHTLRGLSMISGMLVLLLVLMMGSGLCLPPMRAVVISAASPYMFLPKAVCYAGFNAAIQWTVLAGDRHQNRRSKHQVVRYAALIVLCVLLLGNCVLQMHPALIHEPLPFVAMMHVYGKEGYFLGSMCMYLAILSTMTACLRGIGNRRWPLLGIAGVAGLGFSGAIEVVYPILGGCCVLMMLAAKFVNSSGRAFHSGTIML